MKSVLFLVLKCVTCEKETSGAHSCRICKLTCHAISPCCITVVNEEEGFGKNVICQKCSGGKSDNW
jgi:acetaldehyde dehydrogenase (acetylating)